MGGLGELFELSYDTKNGCKAFEGGGVFVFSSFIVFLFLFFQNCYQILRVHLSTYCREIRKCFRRLVELCNEVSTCSSKHHQVQQRVRSKSVGSMNWCACRLPGCPQSWHYFIFAILDWQCLQEGQNNSHTRKQRHVFYRDVLFERGSGGQSCQFVSSWNTWVSSLVLCCKSISLIKNCQWGLSVKRLQIVVEGCFEFSFNLISIQVRAFLKEPS